MHKKTTYGEGNKIFLPKEVFYFNQFQKACKIGE